VIRVANAPVSYGAFELTVGVLPNVPGPDEVMAAVAAAGYEGIELGPLGYLGQRENLRRRLDANGLALVGAFVQIRFGDGDGDLEATLDTLEALGTKPVLADAGPRDSSVPWREVQRVADRARERGFEPTFHPHMGTRVQAPEEIERLLEETDVPLLLDTGHLTAAGGDPVQGLREWRARVNHVHVKDVSSRILAEAPDWDTAWRGGVFCEFGTGDVDLAGFFAELAGYDGWLVVEQDWVPGPQDDATSAVEAQMRNRRWLAEHAGL